MIHQNKAESKKVLCSFPELKCSAFKAFRGLEIDVVHGIGMYGISIIIYVSRY